MKLCWVGGILAEERLCPRLYQNGASQGEEGDQTSISGHSPILWHRLASFGLVAQRGSSSDLNMAARSFSLPDKAGWC